MPVTRLLRLLTIFALLFGSISMAGGHAAMAMPSSAAPMMHHAQDAMAAGHCADMDQNQQDQKGHKGPSIDCTIACSVILSATGEMVERPILTAGAQSLPPVINRSGLNPESDPPPPRLS